MTDFIARFDAIGIFPAISPKKTEGCINSGVVKFLTPKNPENLVILARESTGLMDYVATAGSSGKFSTLDEPAVGLLRKLQPMLHTLSQLERQHPQPQPVIVIPVFHIKAEGR